MFQMKQKNVHSVMGVIYLQCASVAVVELRAQPPEDVVVLPAGLLAFEEHGVWEHHTL